jgi:anti-sigma factor (TIGR02949 family)
MAKSEQVGLRREGSPYTEVECDEIIAKLEELLDGELDPSRREEVEKMVSSCEYCLEQYNVERSLRQVVKDGLKSLKLNGSLLQNIRHQIRQVRNSIANTQQ